VVGAKHLLLRERPGVAVHKHRTTAQRPPVPDHYFGNALVWLGATAAAMYIASEPLVSVAERISATISRMDDELVRSGIDYLELAKVDSRQLRGSMPAAGRRSSG